MIDLILSIMLFLHVYLQFDRLALVRSTAETFIMQAPEIVTKAIRQKLAWLVMYSVLYGLLIWRFAVLLHDFGAWGAGAIILTVIVGGVAFYYLWLQMILAGIKAIGLKIGMG